MKCHRIEELLELLNLDSIKANPFYNNLYNQIALEYLRIGKLDSAEEFLQKSLSKKVLFKSYSFLKESFGSH